MTSQTPSYDSKLTIDPGLWQQVANAINDQPHWTFANEEILYDEMSIANEVSVPNWVSEENGCIPHKAIKVGNGIIVEYKPFRTLGIGYAKIYIVGKDDQPFPKMKGIWEEIHQRSKERKHNPQYPIEGTIAPTGEIRDQYGADAPSFDVLHKFLIDMNLLYSNWKYFPNATSYKKVEVLRNALEAVRAMDGSANYIENDIKDLREQIKAKQVEIAEMEKKLNDLYENAADAMNLLEENGVKVDAKGKVEGVEDDGSEFLSTLAPPGEYFIDNISLTPHISIGKNWSPITIDKPEYDKYSTNGDEYSCATSGH